jgi:uncharacterized protein
MTAFQTVETIGGALENPDAIIAGEVARSLDSRSLNLILLPTEQCNFRCTYCYEGFDQGLMPSWVIAAIKKLIAARVPELDQLSIAWFGGEPLLAVKRIYNLSHYIVSLQQDHPQLHYRASMATNALLLNPERLSELVAYGVTSYQITLDGPADLHDLSRLTRRGKGTFDQIWEHLLAMRNSAYDLQVTLRVHYQPHTFTRLFALIDMLNAEFAEDDRFRVHFKSVARLGGSNDDAIQTTSDYEQKMIESELRAMLKFPTQALEFDDYVCYAGAANSLIIRSNGEVNKCTVALNEDANRIGRINPDGTLTVDQDKYRRWVNALLTGNPEVMACPYFYVLGRALEPLETIA